MAAILFFLAVAMGGAALLFKEAADQVSIGTSWAYDVCATSKLFCGHPDYLGYAAGAALVLALGAKLGSAMR